MTEPVCDGRFLHICREFSPAPRKYSELSMSDWMRYKPRPRSLSESGSSTRCGQSKPGVWSLTRNSTFAALQITSISIAFDFAPSAA